MTKKYEFNFLINKKIIVPYSCYITKFIFYTNTHLNNEFIINLFGKGLKPSIYFQIIKI